MVRETGCQGSRSRQVPALIVELFAAAENHFVDFRLDARVPLTQFCKESCHQRNRSQDMQAAGRFPSRPRGTEGVIDKNFVEGHRSGRNQSQDANADNAVNAINAVSERELRPVDTVDIID